ncbi:MAG TPA: hypothetical protein VKA15_20770, partial [Isosphaeraceae bacterium]|nr:hypothetical protein [Isosphaeraceae bacterium]
QLGGGGTCPWNALAVAAGFTVDSGASLLLGNSGIYTSASTHEAYAFVSGGYISGAGSVTFGSGVSANFAVGSTYNPSGQTVIDTGSPGINVVFTTGSHVGPLGNLTIDPGLVDFSTGATVTAASLNLTGGGILTGSDTLDVSGILTWINGTMDGPGATVAEGGLDLGAGGYLHSNLESRTLINQGTANWAGSGEIDLDAGATFINQSNATFNEHTNTLIRTDGGGFAPSGLFDNRGTFVVHGGGMATMESRFNNEGQVQISSGTWVLSDVGTSSGDFIMNAGASLQLDPLYGIPYTTDLSGHFANSPQIIGGNGKNVTLTSGAGKEPTPLGAITKIAGGFYEETGTVTLSSLDMTGGWLTIKGTLDVVGPMTWTGGFIVGPGSLSVQGGLTLGTGTATTQVLSGVTLFNQSTMTLTAKDVFDQEGGATVVNQILHTVDLQAGAAWTGDGTVVIDNQGTIEATAGTGRATVYDIALVNDGTVTVNSGTLNLEGGGTATGAFTALAQTTLEFGLYSWAFNSTSNVTGAGTVEFSYDGWSSYFNANSIYKVTGTTVIQSGSHYVGVDFIGGDIENLGSLMLEGGTLDFSSGNPVSAASLTQSNGTLLTGSDPVTVSGQLTWKGGVMSGTGSTVADGTLQLGASGDKSDVEILMVRTLKANGGGAIEPLDTLLQFYGSTFVNTAADTLDLGGGVKWESVGDGTSTIDDQGALIVGIVGEAVVSPPTIQGDGNFPFLTCPGAIGVYVGGLNLDCNGSATKTLQASFSVLYPCTLVFGGDFTLEGATGIGGAGNVEVPSGGDLRVTSGASYNVIGTTTIDGGTIEFDDRADTGTLNLSSGDLTGTGTLTVL